MNADEALREIDLISMVGTLTKEEKAEYLRLFVNGSKKHPEMKLRLLCATSGVGNAGIDCPDVRAVYRIDFPPSILDLAQEKGRAGRRPDASPDNFHYFVCYSLETFLYLFKRILDPSETYVTESYRKIQIQQLIEVAQVLITPNTCIPDSLEYLMGRPNSNTHHSSPKCGACTLCNEKKEQFEPLSRKGITKILLDIFISRSEDMIFTMDNTVDYIRKYENSQYLMFKTERKKFELLRIKKVLFQLLTYEILTVVYSSNLKKMLFQLARDGDDILDISITSDFHWRFIPQFREDLDNDNSDNGSNRSDEYNDDDDDDDDNSEDDMII